MKFILTNVENIWIYFWIINGKYLEIKKVSIYVKFNFDIFGIQMPKFDKNVKMFFLTSVESFCSQEILRIGVEFSIFINFKVFN